MSSDDNVIHVSFRSNSYPKWQPAPTGDAFLDELLLYTWATGRKVGLVDGDPAPHAWEMQRRIDLIRISRGLPPVILDEVQIG